MLLVAVSSFAQQTFGCRNLSLLLSLIHPLSCPSPIPPFTSFKGIGLARVLVTRITYVGELGYELHIPTEFALHVYERVCEMGKEHG